MGLLQLSDHVVQIAKLVSKWRTGICYIKPPNLNFLCLTCPSASLAFCTTWPDNCKGPIAHYFCGFQDSIAYLPLIMSISAAVSSLLSKKFVQKIGNKVTLGNEDIELNREKLNRYKSKGSFASVETGASIACIKDIMAVFGTTFETQYVIFSPLACISRCVKLQWRHQ